MPTFSHGKNAAFKIADSIPTTRDISDICKTADLKRDIATAETSAMGNSAKTYIPGLQDATVSIDGYADTTTIGYLNSVYGAITTFEFGPEGDVASSGTPKYTGSCIITSLETSADVSSAVTVKGSIQVTGPITVAAY